MSRLLYHSKAFILASYPQGEADRLYDLLTPRLGRVLALARGVRELKSKLRYNLRELTPVQVSLVSARSHWRLTYVKFDDILSSGDPRLNEKRLLIARLFKLIQRLVAVEGGGFSVPSNPAGLYEEVFQALKFLGQEELDVALRSNCEVLLAWRVLLNLGYCEADRLAWPSEAGQPLWQKKWVEKFTVLRPRVAELIEEALYHSHL